jgi:RNA polymerase sigma-70 factor (ECF subfamily)
MTDWPTIVADHGPLVWNTAHRLLGNDADAADCFQKTFLDAVELAAREPVRHWPAALSRLATARALDLLRSRYRHRRAGPLADDPAGPAADPIEDAAVAELRDRLRAALGGLDPRQAEAFCLVCLDGLTNQQAAEQMGITDGHAGVLLHRARAALREHLAAFDPQREARR